MSVSSRFTDTRKAELCKFGSRYYNQGCGKSHSEGHDASKASKAHNASRSGYSGREREITRSLDVVM